MLRLRGIFFIVLRAIRLETYNKTIIGFSFPLEMYHKIIIGFGFCDYWIRFV